MTNMANLRDEKWAVILNPKAGKQRLRRDWAKMYRFMAEEMLKMETAFLEIRDVIAD